MNDLIAFVSKHATRGACTCGQCIDAPPNPKEQQPTGHTIDMHFFKVAARGEPDAQELKRLVQANKAGAYGDVDLLDGQEHSYMEVGGWIGDQGLALTLMGLGGCLGLWKVLTPRSVLPYIDDAMANELAGIGMVSIIAL